MFAAVLGTGGAANAIGVRAPTVTWAVPPNTTVPPHAHLMIVLEQPGFGVVKELASSVKATLNGKPVAITLTESTNSSYGFVDIFVDSYATGTLQLGYDVKGIKQTAAYRVAGQAVFAVPASWWFLPRDTVAGKLVPVGEQVRHSTVREVYQGFKLTIPQAAVAMNINWRRDARSNWVSMRMPLTEADRGGAGVLLGENFRVQFPPVAMLAAGVELTADAELVDGRTVSITDLPAVVKIAETKSFDPPL